MRRMISYSTIYGEINTDKSGFVLDKALSTNACYNIVVRDNGKIYSTTMTTGAGDNISYGTIVTSGKTVAVISWKKAAASNITISATTIFGTGAIIEVTRVY